MPLINESYIRAGFDISLDIQSERITRAIGQASRRLKGWVGAEAYADAGLSDPQNENRGADLKEAEASLVMHFALLGLNTKFTSAGLLKSTRAEGGAVQSFLSAEEVEGFRALYLQQAEEIARPYLAVLDSQSAEF